MTTEEAWSGGLSFADDTITYRSSHSNWSVPISSIRLIAEYTNSDGPYLDDYFIVFLTAMENGWYEASFYAKGRDELLNALSRNLAAPLDCGLFNSAKYKTRIMWPPHLKDQPLMDTLPPEKSNWWQKLGNSGDRDLRLSTAARQVFA